jgi:5-formyltetrahydrofolate cyclo-ligase
MTKGEIRIDQKKLRSELNEEQKRFYDESILQQLMDTKEFRNCKRIFTYVSFQSEIDTIDIIDKAFLQGKQVYVPKVEAQGMEFYEIKSREGLIRSNYGILEPLGGKENRFISAATKNHQMEHLMLLPGLAFDPHGNRIGYGAGYYDKYLAKHGADTFYKAALAYDFQVIESIPAKEFDIRANQIITPTRSYQCIEA